MTKGETNLQLLLKNLDPQLQDGEFVFCCLQQSRLEQLAINPICQFLEAEGVTLVLSKAEAQQHQLEYSFPSRMISLNVHSSLEAVGLLAAISTKLAEHGISVNAVSAFYHDHLFVPVERVNDAMAVLKSFG